MVAIYVQKIISSMVTVHRRRFHQLWLSTEDDFINGVYLQKKMTSSMVAIYRSRKTSSTGGYLDRI